MKTLTLPFEKLEFGTFFIDPVTNKEYIKVSDDEAEVVDERFRNMSVYGLTYQFGLSETVIIE